MYGQRCAPNLSNLAIPPYGSPFALFFYSWFILGPNTAPLLLVHTPASPPTCPLSDLDVDVYRISSLLYCYWILATRTIYVPCPPDNCLHTVRHSFLHFLWQSETRG